LSIRLPQLDGETPTLILFLREQPVAQAYDFDEIVDLLDTRRPFGDGDLVGIRRTAMPLRKAVALIVEGWADDKFRQLSAILVMKSGHRVNSFHEIKSLYDKAHYVFRVGTADEDRRALPDRLPVLSAT
jgi:hypothetical protein